MGTSSVYVAISIAVLIVVAVLVFVLRGQRSVNRLTPLAGLAFAFVVAGIVFGDNRLIGYGLMGVGVILAVVDMFNQAKRK